MVDVLEAITRSVGDQIQSQLTGHVLDNIGKALRTCSQAKLYRKPYGFRPHIGMGKKIVREGVI
jgi:hypothetical protein